jgi:hypothetical protein
MCNALVAIWPLVLVRIQPARRLVDWAQYTSLTRLQLYRLRRRSLELVLTPPCWHPRHVT